MVTWRASIRLLGGWTQTTLRRANKNSQFHSEMTWNLCITSQKTNTETLSIYITACNHVAWPVSAVGLPARWVVLSAMYHVPLSIGTRSTRTPGGFGLEGNREGTPNKKTEHVVKHTQQTKNQIPGPRAYHHLQVVLIPIERNNINPNSLTGISTTIDKADPT